MRYGWYKKSDSPYYSKKIRDLSLKKDKNKSRLLRLFEYIKRNKNMKVSLFHGTSLNIWESIKKSGHFTSPKVRNVADRESRSAGLEEVFFTTQIDYAMYYANRSSNQDNSNPIILHLEIPLSWIKEVSDVILGTERIDDIYNEYSMHKKIDDIISKEQDYEKTANEILDFFINEYFRGGENEFTIKHSVPIRFVKQTTLANKNFLQFALSEISSKTKKYNLENLIPSYWKDDPKVLQALSANEKEKNDQGLICAYVSNIISSMSNEYELSINCSKLIDFYSDKKSEVNKSLLISCFENYISDMDYSSSLLLIIPLLANGKAFRSFLHKIGIVKEFSNLVKNLVNNYRKQVSNLAANLYEIASYCRTLCEVFSLLEKNIYSLNYLGILNESELSEIEDSLKKGVRSLYLGKLANPNGLIALNETSTSFVFDSKESKRFSMPPLEKDAQALSIYKKSKRNLYLKAILNNANQIDYLDKKTLQGSLENVRNMFKEIPIENDIESQETFVNEAIRLAKNKVAGISMNYDGFAKATTALKYEVHSLRRIPELFFVNPKIKSILQNGIKEISTFLAKKGYNLDQDYLPEELKQDESGVVDYRKIGIKNALEDLSHGGVVSVYSVIDDPELYALYKKFIAQKLSRSQIGNRYDMLFIITCYGLFSGQMKIEKADDIFPLCLEKIKSIIQQENHYIFSYFRVIQDHLASQIMNYNLYKDEFIGDFAKKASSDLLDKFAASIMSKTLEESKLPLSLEFPDLFSLDNELKQKVIKLEMDFVKEKIQTSDDPNQILRMFMNFDYYYKNSQENNEIKNTTDIFSEKTAYTLSNIKFDEFVRLENLLSFRRTSLNESLYKLFNDYPQSFVNIANMYLKYFNDSHLARNRPFYSFINFYNVDINILLSKARGGLMQILKTNTNLISSYIENILSVLEVTVNPHDILTIKQSINTWIKNEVLSDPRVSSMFQKAEKEFFQNQKAKKASIRSSWYYLAKSADQVFQINPNNQDSVYEKFKDTYEKSTGAAWSKEKFLSKANDWRFYGDESGYITVREQRSGMLKLTGMAGSIKGIYKGMQDLLKEKSPIWGMVTKNIASMAVKIGFKEADPSLVQQGIFKIPSYVFGGAKIKSIQPDGGVVFEYSDVGTSVKYLIGNDSYFTILRGFL